MCKLWVPTKTNPKVVAATEVLWPWCGPWYLYLPMHNTNCKMMKVVTVLLHIYRHTIRYSSRGLHCDWTVNLIGSMPNWLHSFSPSSLSSLTTTIHLSVAFEMHIIPICRPCSGLVLLPQSRSLKQQSYQKYWCPAGWSIYPSSSSTQNFVFGVVRFEGSTIKIIKITLVRQSHAAAACAFWGGWKGWAGGGEEGVYI